ncbi:MAG: hypothetical protein AB7O39_06705 [Flavobacteriaceae bacterium]
MKPLSQHAQFVRGLVNPEDLAVVPGTDWVITSGLAGPSHPRGRLYLVHARTRRHEELFPANGTFALDRAQFGDVDRPDMDSFTAHGIGLREEAGGVHTLYMVNHGGRESVEVFTVDARDEKPRLTWIGAVVFPSLYRLNDVAAHPQKGFVVSNLSTGNVENFGKVFSGQPSGCVFRWIDKERPFEIVLGSELNAPNGVEVSADGRWCFVNSWGRKEICRLSLVEPTTAPRHASLEFLPDNLTWTQDRSYLLTTGQFGSAETVMTSFMSADRLGYGFQIARIDPETLAIEILVTYENPDEFGCASTALLVGEEVWVGTARNDGLAIFAPVASSGT